MASKFVHSQSGMDKPVVVNTFDLEPWWTTVPPTVPRESWDELPDLCWQHVLSYLDLCDTARVKSTVFVVGKYAEKYPDRVRQIASRGHEIGFHSKWHDDLSAYRLSDLATEAAEGRRLLEDIAGVPVLSFRAPSFSLPKVPFRDFLLTLSDAGYVLDSSISTASRIHGGNVSATEFPGPQRVALGDGRSIVEIPVPGVDLFGKSVQLLGGGYLRLLPEALLSPVLRSRALHVLYVHAHDFDEHLPKVPGAGMLTNWRRRARIGNLLGKIDRIFSLSDVKTCTDIASSVT